MSGMIGFMGIGVSSLGPETYTQAAQDPIAIIDTLAPGVVLQRSVLDAVWTAWQVNGGKPLTQAQVIAAIGPLPAVLISIPFMREVI